MTRFDIPARREEPEARPTVSGANGGCGEHTPLRIEPESGKIFEDERKTADTSLRVDPNRILQEDESRSHLIGNASDLGPEPAGIVNTGPESGDGPRLAGEPGSDEIHSATPRLTVEGFEFVP
jgi:hypothetical protein